MTERIYKFVFFGSDEICLPCLEFLHMAAGRDWQLLAVVSSPTGGVGAGNSCEPIDWSLR